MSNIRMFSLNSIEGYNKVRSCWHSEGNTTDRCMWQPTCSNLHTERFEEDFNHIRASIQNNGRTPADDPSVDLIRVKNMLNSTISMSYPDVVIACIEHKVSLEAFRAIEAALVKHDNNMKDYSSGG